MDIKNESLEKKSSSITKSNTPYPTDYDPKLDGLGGWLSMIVFWNILTIISWILGFINTNPILSISSIIYDVIIILSVVTSILIFTRNIRFRIIFIFQLSVSLIFAVYKALDMIQPSSGSVFSIIGILIGFGITITLYILCVIYVFKSKRVKNTFIYSKIYK